MKTNENITCACGCGEALLRYDERGRERKFLTGHWSKLRLQSKQTAVECEYCGNVFERPLWHQKRVKHTFCNSTCEGAWSSMYGRRRGASNGHYNTITVPCSSCGAPVSKAESLIKRRNGNIYCPNCVHLVRKGRKGFYVGYPKEFSGVLRTAIRKRDGHTCQWCGKHQSDSGTLHVHHIDYQKTNNAKSNLISLCRTCHGLTNFGTDTWQRIFTDLMRQRYPVDLDGSP
jgi:5-methylcytosine-specific restriction endonuclease McrA